MRTTSSEAPARFPRIIRCSRRKPGVLSTFSAIAPRRAQLLGGPKRQARAQSAIDIADVPRSRTGGNPNGMAQQAARCCHVISRSRTMRERSEGSSTVVSANGMRGLKLLEELRALWRAAAHPAGSRSGAGRSASPAGRRIQPHTSQFLRCASPGDRPAIPGARRRPHNQIRPERLRKTLQAPTSQAAQSPPAESTSAVNIPELHRIARPFPPTPVSGSRLCATSGCRLRLRSLPNGTSRTVR